MARKRERARDDAAAVGGGARPPSGRGASGLRPGFKNIVCALSLDDHAKVKAAAGLLPEVRSMTDFAERAVLAAAERVLRDRGLAGEYGL